MGSCVGECLNSEMGKEQWERKVGRGGWWRYISYRGWRLGWKEEVKVKLKYRYVFSVRYISNGYRGDYMAGPDIYII